MKGGPNTGFAKIICNGCYVVDDAIFYRSEGPYGQIDYCFECVGLRLPVGWQPEVVCLPISTGFIDHVRLAKIRSWAKVGSYQLEMFAA
jgi:hypothetical protein